jgi:hypothetical protein
MPGFFDIIFRAPKPEPKAPKPKKTKKAKKAKKAMKPKDEGPTLVERLEAEIAELREMVTPPEPEPEIVTEEPDDDESS